MSEKKVIFHGGCVPCSSQEEQGVDRCVGCQFFDANWNLPDLSINRERDKMNVYKNEIRSRVGKKRKWLKWTTTKS